jgi:HK97 family phage major capsid protein
MRRLARTIPTSRDKIQFPAVAPNSTSGSIYSSGFVGGWVGETPAFSDTDPTFQQFEIGIKKARVATKLSNDWLADAAANMLAFLAQNGAENLGLVEDNGFIAGTGANNQPLGILNAGISTVDVEGSTANLILNTTSNAGSGPKLVALPFNVPSQYAERAQWLFCRSIEGKIAALVDANGRSFMQMNATGGGSQATSRTINGYPVNNSEFVPNDGSDTNKVVVFGDFSAYIIAQRAAMSTVVLRERFADTDQTGIIIFERVGGGLWNTDALRIGVV